MRQNLVAPKKQAERFVWEKGITEHKVNKIHFWERSNEGNTY